MTLQTRILKLNKKNIALLQFLLEGYEGICSVSTVDSQAALVSVSAMPGFESTMEKILSQLRLEFDFDELSNSIEERIP